jgi:hypothetical protein
MSPFDFPQQSHPAMIRVLVVFALLVFGAASVSATNIILPDANVYYYWIRGTSGSVTRAPRKTDGSGTITLPPSVGQNGTLYILDPHTGEIAAVSLTTVAVTPVTIDEFHLLTAPAPPIALQGATVPSSHPDSPAAQKPSWSAHVATTLLDGAIAVAVVWFLRRLYLTRGQLLIDAARKVGVDMPNPNDPPPSVVDVDGSYEAPVRKRVERIPDTAFEPLPAAHSNGFLVMADGSSYGIGLRPLSIGRDGDNDIVLNDSSVSRHHARVELSADYAQIIDQGSANGVYVNGERVQTALITPGARISIGNVPIRYEK